MVVDEKIFKGSERSSASSVIREADLEDFCGNISNNPLYRSRRQA
jgi:hypothetical protein